MTEQKYRGGRKPYSPTPDHRKQVEAMASYGIPQDDIAKVIKISGNTLRKYFRDELDIAETKANAVVAQNLFRQATKDDPRSIPAAIFWAKTRMKWKETVVNENVGKDGSPIEYLVSFDLTKLTDEELAAYRTLHAAAGRDRKGD